MDGMEMQGLHEAARVAEKLADFAGSVIMQLLQKQGYVEEKGVKALLSHVREGGGTLTTVVSEERAEAFRGLLREAHIPYVEIARTEPGTGERSLFFVYRDCDCDRMGDVLKEFALRIDRSCHEVDIETFGRMAAGKTYGMAVGLTREEVYAFREAAGAHDIQYCVVADGSRYGIVADSCPGLRGALGDMCRNLSGAEGREYAAALEDYLAQQERLAARMEPEPGKVKYLVNAKNPAVFLAVDGRGITTHSVEGRPELQPDGSVGTVVSDCRHVRYPYSRGQLGRLAEKVHDAVVLTEEEFSGMVEGIGADGGAVLSQDFVRGYDAFVERMAGRAALPRLPERSAFRGEGEPAPEERKEMEREAVERIRKFEVMERVMSREQADRIRDRAIDRKMSQEPGRV